MIKQYMNVMIDIEDRGSNRNRVDMSKKDVKFSKILKELMKQRGIGPKALGKECHIPQSTLSTYLSGEKESYSPSHLLALADYFEVSIDYLLTKREKPIKSLNSLPTESVYNGWLHVTINRAIPGEADDD